MLEDQILEDYNYELWNAILGDKKVSVFEVYRTFAVTHLDPKGSLFRICKRGKLKNLNTKNFRFIFKPLYQIEGRVAGNYADYMSSKISLNKPFRICIIENDWDIDLNEDVDYIEQNKIVIVETHVK